MKKLIVGNWKMNGTLDSARALVADVVNGVYQRQGLLDRCDLVLCPPFVHISAVRHALYTTDYITLGAQDCSAYDNGARTGDVSAAMLYDSKCRYVIVGHSERRQHNREADSFVALKAGQAHKHGLVAIICVGEREEDRAEGRHMAVVEKQLLASLPDSATAENTVIAYEPVWAIGTGRTATPADAGQMHWFIREKLKGRVSALESVRILYGGSIKPDNAKALLAEAHIDGGLVGGASLKAEDFLAIARSA